VNKINVAQKTCTRKNRLAPHQLCKERIDLRNSNFKGSDKTKVYLRMETLKETVAVYLLSEACHKN
jgi:hypothetical protein